jgi:hypothetical protein
MKNPEEENKIIGNTNIENNGKERIEEIIKKLKELNKLEVFPVLDIEKYIKEDGLFINIFKYFALNLNANFINLIFSWILDYYTDSNWMLLLLTFPIALLNSHFLHYISHKRYIHKFLGFDLHDIHHGPHSQEFWNVIIETIVNFVLGGFYLIPLNILIVRFFGKSFKIFNYYIILLWSLIYVTTHLINYHYLKFKTHENHHKLNGTTNYGPEIIDILFKTKPNVDVIEDDGSLCINTVFCTIFILLIYNSPYDPIKLLNEFILPKEILESPNTDILDTFMKKYIIKPS